MLKKLFLIDPKLKLILIIAVIIIIVITYSYIRATTVTCIPIPIGEGNNLGKTVLQPSIYYHKKILQAWLEDTVDSHTINLQRANATLHVISILGQFPDWDRLDFYIHSVAFEVGLTDLSIRKSITEITKHIKAIEQINPYSPIVFEAIKIRTEAMENIHDRVLLLEKVHEILQAERTKLTNVPAKGIKILDKTTIRIVGALCDIKRNLHAFKSSIEPHVTVNHQVATTIESIPLKKK